MTFEEFKQHYATYGWCLGDLSRPTKPLNEKKLVTKFNSWLKKQQRFQRASEFDTTSSLDQEVRAAVKKRDKTCRLLQILTPERLVILKKNAGPWIRQLDAAHVFGKGSHPWMRYRLSNVILLNRYSHSMLDTGHDPVSGALLSGEYIRLWWRILVGEPEYESLEEDANNRRKAWHEITS